MADRQYGDIVADTTQFSSDVILRSSLDNSPMTGIAFGSVTAFYYRQGASAPVAITMASVATPDAAWVSGGWVQIAPITFTGRYRFDIPNAAFAAGADWVGLQVRVTGAFNYDIQYRIQSAGMIPDQILRRDFSQVTGEAARSMLNALRFLRNRWVASPTALSVHKEDDSTVAWTGSLSTSTGAATITAVDPA